MVRDLRHLVIAMTLIISSLASIAQEQIKVMSYNLLNFPLGDMPSRMDTLKIVIDHYQPDLFFGQELKAEFALIGIEGLLDDLGEDDYEYAPWISQQSNPGGSFLQQGLVYNTRLFGLTDQDVILTPVRDVNYYKLYFRDAALDQGADTTHLHIFITHLKSSSGSDNEQLRLESVQDFLPYLNELASDDLVMFAGDLNVYSSSEPAYQALLSASNDPQLYDPIDSPGSWTSSNYPLKHILTQSTRTVQLYGDGSTGGLDDRFDFILCSGSLLDPASQIHYVENTYEAFGNSGECYNDDILDCAGTNGLPDAVTSALYYLSDHLPVVMELETSLEVGVAQYFIKSSDFCNWIPSENALLFSPDFTGTILIVDTRGRIIEQTRVNGGEKVRLELTPGVYIVHDTIGQSYKFAVTTSR